jgi:transcriptional regulator with XRE-family HTH domain
MGLHIPEPELIDDGVDRTDIDRKVFTYKVNIAIGQTIRKARKLRKLTQTDLASRLEVSFQQVQKYENGANRIPLSALLLVSLALDVPIPDLFSDIAENFEPSISSRQEMRMMRAFRAIGTTVD